MKPSIITHIANKIINLLLNLSKKFNCSRREAIIVNVCIFSYAKICSTNF